MITYPMTPVHLQGFHVLLSFALTHPHSRQWISPLRKLIAKQAKLATTSFTPVRMKPTLSGGDDLEEQDLLPGGEP
jgi:hypothetical protein